MTAEPVVVAPTAAVGARVWRNEPSAAIGLLLLAPALLLLALFFVVSIVRIMWVAVANPTFSLEHFADFFASPAARRSLLTTLRVSAIVTLLATLLGLVIAWELRTTRSRWKRAALWSATLFPLWTRVVVRNYAFTILLQRKGVINTALVPATLLAPVDADHVRVAALGREAIVRRGGPSLGADVSLAIRPGKLRLRPAPGNLTLPATVLDVLYLGDSVRIVGRQPAAGEVVIRADPDEAAGVTIGQELTLGFASDDAVAVDGSV
jgi:TOBE domain